MQARDCSPVSQLDPLGPIFEGRAPFSHRAWLHCVTAYRRAMDARYGRRAPVDPPTIRVQVRKHGATFCGIVVDPRQSLSGAELYLVELEHLGRVVVQSRNVRACPPNGCICRGGGR